jgi:hypothetical protein
MLSVLDLKSGYWQASLHPYTRKYSAFRICRGLYQFRVLPFGLKNSPMTFVQLVNEVLRRYLDEFVQVYLDDIVIFSENLDEHQYHLYKVFERLLQFGLTCHTKKYRIKSTEISFLGHLVDSEGIHKRHLQHPKRMSFIVTGCPPSPHSRILAIRRPSYVRHHRIIKIRYLRTYTRGDSDHMDSYVLSYGFLRRNA